MRNHTGYDPKILKVVIDYHAAHYGLSDGLLMRDSLRIASDLEKIVKIPLLADDISDVLGITYKKPTKIKVHKLVNAYDAWLPLRRVSVICDTIDNIEKIFLKGLKENERHTGRLLGYKISDEIHKFFGEFRVSDMTNGFPKAINEWYSRPNGRGSQLKLLGSQNLTLKELDEL